jgi:hypothetical protein
MVFTELEAHLAEVGLSVDHATADGQSYAVIRDLEVAAGSHAGKTCDVALLRSDANPWVPQAAIHVRPHLVPMGERNSQKSPLGSEWQYLSRRFDPVPTPRGFFAHILTVLGEL